MRPVLLRRIGIPDARAGVAAIIREIPADWYLYGHFSLYDETVEGLTEEGKRVVRELNFLHADFTSQGWVATSLNGFLYRLANEQGLWLKTKGGDPLSCNWSGEGAIYNLAKLTPHLARRIAEFFRAQKHTRWLLLDQCWPRLFSWMLEDPKVRMRDLAEYSHLNYFRGWQYLLKALGWPRRRRSLWVNGAWNWDTLGLQTSYENADTGNRGRFLWRTVKRWLDRPGSILSIEGAPHQLHVRKIVGIWIHYGGILWLRNHSAASYAWFERERMMKTYPARVAGPGKR